MEDWWSLRRERSFNSGTVVGGFVDMSSLEIS